MLYAPKRSHRQYQDEWLRAYKLDALVEQKYRCAYCKGPLNAQTVTADHRWSRAKRGGTTKDNIAASCAPCNVAKGSMSHVEVYRILKKKTPPSGASNGILIMWAAHRIWKRTIKACERIERHAR
jgi:5-methylcytosine-specific restriction endonuclease McrA